MLLRKWLLDSELCPIHYLELKILRWTMCSAKSGFNESLSCLFSFLFFSYFYKNARNRKNKLKKLLFYLFLSHINNNWSYKPDLQHWLPLSYSLLHFTKLQTDKTIPGYFCMIERWYLLRTLWIRYIYCLYTVTGGLRLVSWNPVFPSIAST